MAWTGRKDEKNTTSFHQNATRADTTRSRWNNIFPLMLVAIRNLVELVRSRRRLGGVSYTPVEGPISFTGGRERRFLVEQKWMCAFWCAAIVSSSEFRIKRCTVLRFRNVITAASGLFSVAKLTFRVVLFEPSPPKEAFCELLSKQ